VSFAPNQLIKQGAKLVVGWEDVVEELPTEIRAELFPVEATTQEERASLFEANLSPIEKRLFDLIRIEEPIHVDELVETTGLSSSETLAALCVKWKCAGSSGSCRESSLCAYCFSNEFGFR
jgi:predicted Rossmann fold nucleotide-binding protein DprA/Smf involved in DNA uptake